MEKKPFKFGYVPELDGMRGFAILAVMVFHAISHIFTGGFIGVDIFFVISGFLITALLIKEYDRYEHIGLKNFYFRRILRLGPALIFFLLVYSIASFWLFEHWKALSNVTDSLIALFYMSNWARAFDIHTPDFLGHTWSLSIEEQFYILWPLTLRFLLKKIPSRKTILILVSSVAFFSWMLRIILSINGTSVERLYNGLDTRADSLLMGCALGIAMSSNLISSNIQHKFSTILKYISPLAALILIIVIFTAKEGSMSYYYWLLFLVEVLAVILILNIFLARNSILSRIFSNKQLVWVGSISYGLYLWHYPIFRWIGSYYHFSIVITIGTIATFIIATASYYLLEKPFLKLKNKFSSVVINNKNLKKIEEQPVIKPLESKN